MTQVHDDDLDNVWYDGRLTSVPDLEDEDDPRPTGQYDPVEDWDRDGHEAPASSAPETTSKL
mgnify:CR=1 FL=1